MNWNEWALTASAIFMFFTVFALVIEIKRTRFRLLTTRNVLITGTFISSCVILFPVYLANISVFSSILMSIQHAIRLFAFDNRFFELINRGEGLTEYYMIMLASLYVFAPMLSISLVISLFQNIVSYLKYKFSFSKDMHIFSELNEKTLALGKSLDDKYNKINGKYRNIKRTVIVYTDISDKDKETSFNLLEEAENIGAILFRNDLASISFNNWRIFSGSKRKVSFYLISDDEQKKIRLAENIISNYKSDRSVKLFLFSDSIESKCFFDSYSDDEKREIKMQVARVNDVRALIYHNLNDNGIELFEKAAQLKDGTREVSVVVVGLGKYGMETIKSLLWYCQLPGYRVKITAFDESKEAKSMFQAACPEIKVDENIDEIGDMRYTVNIRKAIFGTEDFYSELEKIGDIARVFISLGSDRQNIMATVGIRNRLAKQKCFPNIETIVYDSNLKDRVALDWVHEKINMIGDLQGFYSEGTVINSDLIEDAIITHKRWDNSENAENNFYMNDYNYCSSMANALHRNLRKKIISYTKDKEIVFPFYYSDKEQRALRDANVRFSTMKTVFPLINDNDNIKKMSSKMNTFGDFLYIKLAHIHYNKLSVSERRAVIADVEDFLTTKGIDASIPMAADSVGYIEGYDEYVDNISYNEQKKALKRIFDSIVKLKTKTIADEEMKRKIVHSFEYFALNDDEKKAVREYLSHHIENMNDAMFVECLEYANCFAAVEHIRWNAYIRTEGFRCAIETNKKYKLHYDLVPSELLTIADCIKDI